MHDRPSSDRGRAAALLLAAILPAATLPAAILIADILPVALSAAAIPQVTGSGPSTPAATTVLQEPAEPSPSQAEPPPSPEKPSPSRAEPSPSPAPLASRRQRAAELLLRGKADEAAALYGEVLASEPTDAISMEGRVHALIVAGNWRRALEEARGFASSRPASAPLQTALGEALYRAGRLDEARSTLEPVVDGEPSAYRALLTLGLVRQAEGREEEGNRLLARALALAPEDREVLFWTAGAAATRAGAVELLERYLARSEGDDADRVEGARGTVRLYKALGERPVWVRASRPLRVEVPLLSLRNREGRVTGFVVELTVEGGKRLRVLLDSGSTGLFVLERIALKARLEPLSEETTFGGGREGRHASRRGLLPEVGLGDLRFTDALVSTTTEELEPTGRYHGLLGLSIFEGYRITLDLQRERLILERSPGATSDPVKAAEHSPDSTKPSSKEMAPEPSQDSAKAPTNETPAKSGTDAPTSTATKTADHETSARPAEPRRQRSVEPGTSEAVTPPGVPYWDVSSQMLVQAATSDGRDGLFLFDTGASKSLLSLDLVESGTVPKLGEPADVRAYGGPLRDARVVRGVRLKFQGLESEASLTAADLRQRSRLGGVEVSGYLGLDALARAIITIDTSSHRVAIARPGKR